MLPIRASINQLSNIRAEVNMTSGSSNSQAKNWCFTLNNPTEEQKELLLSLYEPTVIQYMVWQEEEGEEHTRHLQGYIQFIKRLRFNQVKALLCEECHVEVARGSAEQNHTYCTKEPRLDGPWERGTIKSQGERTDLKEVARQITSGKRVRDLVDTAPECIIKYSRGLRALESESRAKVCSSTRRLDMLVTVIIGDTGVGKTRHVLDKHGDENVYIVDCQNEKLWFDGYNGQKVLLLDDFYGGIKYHFLLRLLDVYPLQVEIKGGYVWAEWNRVYITSNKEPSQWYVKHFEGGLPAPLRRRIHQCCKMVKVENHPATIEVLWDDIIEFDENSQGSDLGSGNHFPPLDVQPVGSNK